MKFVVLLLLIAFVAGCGGPNMYVNEEADFGFYTRVGVVIFANYSTDQRAATKVTSTFINEILRLEAVAVPSPGGFNSVVEEVMAGRGADIVAELTPEDAMAIGQAAEVEGIFLGAVKDHQMVRSGQNEFPLVTIMVRFIDCQTGTVVWTFEETKKGGPKFPIFSFGETHTMGEMAVKVCRDAAEAFGQLMR